MNDHIKTVSFLDEVQMMYMYYQSLSMECEYTTH